MKINKTYVWKDPKKTQKNELNRFRNGGHLKSRYPKFESKILLKTRGSPYHLIGIAT
jgi:hypothetical protein